MDRKYRMLDAHILQAQGFTQREIGAMIGVTDRTGSGGGNGFRRLAVCSDRHDDFDAEVLQRSLVVGTDIIGD